MDKTRHHQNYCDVCRKKFSLWEFICIRAPESIWFCRSCLDKDSAQEKPDTPKWNWLVIQYSDDMSIGRFMELEKKEGKLIPLQPIQDYFNKVIDAYEVLNIMGFVVNQANTNILIQGREKFLQLPDGNPSVARWRFPMEFDQWFANRKTKWDAVLLTFIRLTSINWLSESAA